MEPLEEFHCFTRLPRELQLAIWDIYAEDMPRARHYLYLDHVTSGRQPPCRYYSAVNIKTDKPLPISTNAADPVKTDRIDPNAGLEKTKIRLTGRVSTAEARRAWGVQHISIDDVQPTDGLHIVANLKYDVFLFYVASVPSHYGWLQYLAHNHTRKNPSDLAHSHWFFEIQKLAFVVTSDNNRDLSEFDRRTLSRHSSLRTIHILVPVHQIYKYRAYHTARRQSNKVSFVPLDEILSVHQHEDSQLCNCEWREPAQAAQRLKSSLEELVQHGERQVDISIVLEGRVQDEYCVDMPPNGMI